MKRLILSLLVTLALPAMAQNYVLQSLTLSTNTVPADTTNTFNDVIDARASVVPVQVTFKLSGAGTDDQTLTFEQSVDRTNWFELGDVVIAATGTNSVTAVTNLTPLTGWGYLRLSTWDNDAAAEAVTNLAVVYSLKF
jgi:hypothetical protein